MSTNKKTENSEAPKAHSEDYFDETRDYWWNKDFLQLMGTRLGLASVRSVLDVGCGVGHWGQLWAPILNETVRLEGIDFEPSSIAKAQERAQHRGLSQRFTYRVGDAQVLPYDDDHFDLVTCQTLLIHLKDPKVCLKEMLRVLKPGGILMVAEPNNFANRAVFDTHLRSLSAEAILERLEFDFRIQSGKSNLGLGFNSEGDLIPGALAALGAKQIQVYKSDKCVPFFPPYESPEEKAFIQQMEEWLARGFAGWDREEMRGYYLAGGGKAEGFDHLWEQQLSDSKAVLQSMKKGTYSTSGGSMHYLICAKK